MTQTSTPQVSFIDAMVRHPKGIEDHVLMRMSRLLDWRPIERRLHTLSCSETGRPSYPPEMMFRILLLEHVYDLSDPEAEFRVADSQVFRRFVGLRLDEAVPDETTICRFRERLRASGQLERVFAEVNRQLHKRGLLLRKATIVDATLIESAAAWPRADHPSSDPDASWTKGKGTRDGHFGYKAHVSVDATHGLIEAALLTTASVADTTHFETLLPPKTRAVYADKGYTKRARSAKLQRRGIRSCIMDRGYRNHPLTRRQVARNKRLAPVRAGIERVFAHWKRWYGYEVARYRGLERNQGQLTMLSIAYNLKRSARILGSPPVIAT